MKRYAILLPLLAALIFIACAGGKSTPDKPRHLTAGIKPLNEGIDAYNQGCYRRALDFFFMAHELFSASDQPAGVAMSLNNIGNVYRIIGDMESAVLFLEESFDIYADLKDTVGMVQVLSNKAAAHIDSGRLEEAARDLDAAEDIARKNKIAYIPLLSNRGILYTKQKDYAGAKQILETALSKVDPADLSEYATINFAWGKLMGSTGHHERAVAFFKTALAADRSSGFYKGIADDLAAIGSAYLRFEKNELAANYFKRSIKIYALIDHRKKVEAVLDELEHISDIGADDISVTLHFVNQWLEGKALESPCN